MLPATEKRLAGLVVPIPTLVLVVSNVRSGIADVDVAKEKALRAVGMVVVLELVKLSRPPLIVRESVEASPIWRLPRKPAFETNVELAVTVRRSVEASPMKESPVLPNLVSVVEPVTVRLVKESPVPCPCVNRKFWRVEEAVVEVAESVPTVR